MKENNEKVIVSVVIPFYNVENYFDKCLKSVISQTYNNIEIILVNNNSTDNSLLIAKKYKNLDNRIRIYNQKKQSIILSRKFGINKCKGQYIISLDADDYLESNMIEKMLFIALKNKSDCVQCSFDVKGEKKEKWIFPSFTRKFNDGGVYIINKWLDGSLYVGSQIDTKLFKKRVIQNAYNKIESIRSLGDDVIVFLIYICNSIKITSLSDILYHYNYRNESTSHNLTNESDLVQEFLFINEAYLYLIRNYHNKVDEKKINKWYLNMSKYYLDKYYCVK